MIFFLVPTRIGNGESSGGTELEWWMVETKEAAEMLRDIRHGLPPFFAMRVEAIIQPGIQH